MTELMRAIESLKGAAEEAEAEWTLGAVGEELTALVRAVEGVVRMETAELGS